MNGILSMFGGEEEPAPMAGPPMNTQAQPQGMFQQIQQGAANNSGLLMAAAAGIGKGTTMGNMFSSIQDHYQMQEQIKGRKEDKANALQLKKEQLEEQKRLNTAKVQNYSAKAAQGGMPKKIGGAGGQTTLVWPDGQITSHLDTEVQEIYQTAEAAKTGRAELMSNGKLQSTFDTPAATAAAVEASTKVSELEKGLESFTSLKKAMEETGGISMVSRIMPNGISETWNRILGTQDGKLQAGVAKLNMKNFIGLVSGFPGALSNKEGDRIALALPKVDDDPALWKQFFDENGPILMAAYEKAKAQEAQMNQRREQVQALPSFANGGGAKLQQSYPGKTKFPSNGRAPVEDQRAILEQEFAAEQAKPGGGTPANLQALRSELGRLGFTPQVSAPKAAQGKAPPQFSTPADVKAALAAGTLKSGDYFLDPKGNKRKVN